MKQIVIKLSQTVKSIEEAEQARNTLREYDHRLRLAIEREKRKNADPIVRNLNRRIAKGETLYFEFLGGKYHAVCDKNKGTGRFGLRKNGGLVCGRHEDFEKYAPIDRVYKLNFNDKPELVYEGQSRSPSCGKKLKL